MKDSMRGQDKPGGFICVDEGINAGGRGQAGES